jgi:hypothetical protein
MVWSASTIVTIIKDWKPIYDSDTCDGIQWTLVLNTDTAKYNFYGSNYFPENFDMLVLLLRRIKGLEYFTDGHLENDI